MKGVRNSLNQNEKRMTENHCFAGEEFGYL
jgi:hypothetical protein